MVTWIENPKVCSICLAPAVYTVLYILYVFISPCLKELIIYGPYLAYILGPSNLPACLCSIGENPWLHVHIVSWLGFEMNSQCCTDHQAILPYPSKRWGVSSNGGHVFCWHLSKRGLYSHFLLHPFMTVSLGSHLCSWCVFQVLCAVHFAVLMHFCMRMCFFFNVPF